MDRALLPHLPSVLAVARNRSFARAAAELGIGTSAVSHAIRTAEQRLGAPLFRRTTRSVTLTEAGEAFVAVAQHAFDQIGAAADRLQTDQRDLTGVLRVNAPRVAFFMGLTPILAEMARRHPRLTVEVVGEDALVDVVAERFDAGIRLGEMIAHDMVAVRMTPPFRATMVAAPAYLARQGTPTMLDDLAGHNCIGFRLLASGAVYDWELLDGERDVVVPVNGTVRVSDPSYARDLALAGIGIAYVFEPLVAADLAAGQLVEVMPAAAIEEPGLFLYYPRRATDDRKLRAFVEVMRDQLRRTG
ncbi:LysR family transcriptional regulator [Sphingomonas sp.]|uniref:LysR family transcriptional regulator n=1 Tax=Sphingomonas sp. TaxID=28214 RepID=UPI001E16BD69|nr:LysR family transcriptional regulator [Sphingomonas sp.]MBX9797565.1 LysR family transcriptional regulator [Sphingomonas sp.]